MLTLGLLVSACGTHQKAPILQPNMLASKQQAGAQSNLQVAYAALPLAFEANQGQTDERVDFLARGRGYMVFLTSTEAVFALPQNPTAQRQEHRVATHHPQLSDSGPRTTDSGLILRMQLVGANVNPRGAGGKELPGKVHYFRGNDPQKWRTNIPTYAKVKYQEVYPGVDLVYYGNQRQLEYDFVIAPGVDPRIIRLAFADLGETSFRIDLNGDLILGVAGGEVRLLAPHVYQESDGVKHAISGRYVLPRSATTDSGFHEVGFEVAAYDLSKPLIIDPVLSYSSFLGGSGLETGDNGVGNPFGNLTVDSAGNAYVVGSTSSVDFPTVSPLQASLGGGTDAFITKVKPDGTGLLSSTYLGGSGSDVALNIALDSSGAYITGYTCSSDFPTWHPLQASLGGNCDAFITKMNLGVTMLLFSTYLGGSGNDDGHGIAVDSSGNVYVTGTGDPATFPTTPGAFQDSPGGSAFVAKLNATATALVYSGFLGGRDGLDIAVDASGSAYVTGITYADAHFPTPGALQTTYGGGISDGFVAKVNPTGSARAYFSYLGGSASDDNGYAIAVDSSGNAYVTGSTQSSDFPITPGAFQTTKKGIWNVFVTKVNPSGTAMVYSTYIGGSTPYAGDYGNEIVLDSAGSAYITGQTGSPDFPTTPDAFQLAYGGGSSDAYVAKLKPDGSGLVYSSYLGGKGAEIAFGIGLDASGNAYVAGTSYVGGTTNANDFPTVNPFQATYGGGSADAFVAKFSFVTCGDGVVTGGEQCDDGNTINGDGCSAICKTEYLFNGFFQPIDNVPVVNVAKAGQGIPVKWHLTTASGAPITDPASFVSLSSATVPCGAFSGGTDDIETYTGTSGLQSLGNGDWQFNWTTPKSYAGQCRILRLNLADQAGTSSSRTADFKFK